MKLLYSTSMKISWSSFLPILDYGDYFYRNNSKTTLHSLDSVYHSVLRYITGTRYSTHHCELYEMVGWPSLSVRRQIHWIIFVYKAIIGQLPSYLSAFLSTIKSWYNLRSSSSILLDVPIVRSVYGQAAISYCVPYA